MPDSTPEIWTARRDAAGERSARPRIMLALRRGIAGACPACGQGRIFAGWLRQADACGVCGARLGDIRADDAPPYFTIFIVAHVAVGSLAAAEIYTPLSNAAMLAIFLPATLALTLGLIRPVKGATISIMYILGFSKPPDVRRDAG